MNRKKLISTLSVASAVLATGLLAQEAQADEVVSSPDAKAAESASQTALNQASQDYTTKVGTYNDTVAAYNQQVSTVNTAVATANAAVAETNQASEAVRQAQTAVSDQSTAIRQQEQTVATAQAELDKAETALANPQDVVHEETSYHQENNMSSMENHRNAEKYYATPDIIDGSAGVTEVDGYDVKEEFADMQPADGKTVLTTELTDDQAKSLKDTHVVTYTPNNDKVNENVAKFVQQLREQNGLNVGVNESNLEVGGSTQIWAQLRAEENAKNESIGHASSITAKDLHAAGAYNGDTNDTKAGWTSELAGSFDVILGYTDINLGFNGDGGVNTPKNTMGNSMITSDEQLAYTLVRAFVNDFGNKDTKMGHARHLLQSQDYIGVGLKIDTLQPVVDANFNNIPGLYNAHIYVVIRTAQNSTGRVRTPNYEFYIQDNGFQAIKNLEKGGNVQNLPLMEGRIKYVEKADIPKLQAAVDSAKAVLGVATGDLILAKADLTAKQEALTQAEQAYKVASAKASQAKTVVTTEKATLARLGTALETARTEKESAKAHYDSVKAVYDAEVKAKQEAEERAKQEAAQKAAELAARQEAERKAAAEKAAQAAAEKARQEAEQKAAEQRAKEAAAQAARQEAERKAAAEKAAQEAAKQAQAEADRKAQEAAQAQAEAQRLAEEAQKAAAANKAEAEAKAQAAQAEAERKAQEAQTAADKATNANQAATTAQADASQAEANAKAAEAAANQAKAEAEQANTAASQAEAAAKNGQGQASVLTPLSYRTLNRTATAQATQDVINRRQAPSYQASLPETGDDNVAVYSLVGIGLLGIAGVAGRKRRG